MVSNTHDQPWTLVPRPQPKSAPKQYPVPGLKAHEVFQRLTFQQRKWFTIYCLTDTRWVDLPADCRAAFKNYCMVRQNSLGEWRVNAQGRAVFRIMKNYGGPAR